VLAFTEDDRILWMLPLAYHFAVTIVRLRARRVAHPVVPDTLPRALVDATRRLRPSVLYASPLHFERMGHLGPSEPLASLRLVLSTSAPITQAVMDRFESVYRVPVGQANGIIECGLRASNLPRDGVPANRGGPTRSGLRDRRALR